MKTHVENGKNGLWVFDDQVCDTEVVFTLDRIVKRSVAKSVLDRASVHTRNVTFEAVSAPELYSAVESATFRNRTLNLVHRVQEQLLERSKNLSGTV